MKLLSKQMKENYQKFTLTYGIVLPETHRTCLKKKKSRQPKAKIIRTVQGQVSYRTLVVDTVWKYIPIIF